MSGERTGRTLALRLLDSNRVAYERIDFPESIHDARGVAEHLGLPASEVFKTLVILVDPPPGRPALVLAPAETELDLKQLARALSSKRVEMAGREQAERLTGLQAGGISALALTHRGWPVYLDRTAAALDQIVVSGGRRGLDVRLPVEALMRLTGAAWIEAARKPQSIMPGPRARTSEE